MKKVLHLAVLTTVATSALAGTKVIYGEDNRKEVYEVSEELQKLARAAATMIHHKEITRSSTSGKVNLTQTTLKDWLESSMESKGYGLKSSPLSLKKALSQDVTFCEDTRFVNQPNPGMCSGFLIAPDLVATAGHCVEVENFCEEYRWVFDFKMDESTQTAGLNIDDKDVYKCKKVVSSALSGPLGLDYGIIQLERLVKDREPVEYRNTSMVPAKTPLVVIGNPSGLPLKVADGAAVRSTEHHFYFTANLDTFQGNSGSAVFNAKTGKVEGILVRGEEDYTGDMDRMCVTTFNCKDDECRGEDVSRMTSIPEVALQKVFFQAALTEDTQTLKKVLSKKFWIDFYGKDRQSALLKAAAAGKMVSLEYLLKNGAEATLTDKEGNTVLHLLAPHLNKSHTALVKSLLDATVPVDARNALGESALDLAMKHLNVEGITLLINAGGVKKGNLLIPFAQAGKLTEMFELMTLEENKEPVLTFKNAQGQTLLSQAAASGDYASVAKLIALGSAVDEKDKFGESALFHAIRAQSLPSLELLIAAGAEVESANLAGVTPKSLAKLVKFKAGKRLLRKTLRTKK
jgi:ankyrin repeat protein/V8-like Glu-specific endopeptidase